MTDFEINAFGSASALDEAEAAEKAHLLKKMEEMANDKKAFEASDVLPV